MLKPIYRFSKALTAPLDLWVYDWQQSESGWFGADSERTISWGADVNAKSNFVPSAWFIRKAATCEILMHYGWTLIRMPWWRMFVKP